MSAVWQICETRRFLQSESRHGSRFLHIIVLKSRSWLPYGPFLGRCSFVRSNVASPPKQGKLQLMHLNSRVERKAASREVASGSHSHWVLLLVLWQILYSEGLGAAIRGEIDLSTRWASPVSEDDESYDSAKGPRPEDIYPVPIELLNCVFEIAPRIQKSGAWWSLTGDLSENMMGVHVRPTEIEILTDGVGLEKVSEALSSYDLAPIVLTERKLDREAEVGLDFKTHPVFERCRFTEFASKGAKVAVKSDCQLKVGDWEWGDPLFFDPEFTNLRGIFIPLMPLSLKSELYITLGWLDRAKLISDAVSRSTTRMHEPTPKPRD